MEVHEEQAYRQAIEHALTKPFVIDSEHKVYSE